MTVDRPTWAPGDVDLERPSVARVYDYYLGGAHNFAVDRELAEQAMIAMPELPMIMHANRAFLRRAVRTLVGLGIDQFLDLGSGMPTVGHVHEIAHQVDPAARVVYVDNDPVAFAHSRAMLDGDPRVAVVHADLREPEALFNNPVLHRHVDLTRPVAVLMVAVLHFVPDSDDPAKIISAYRERVVPGSYLVVSHASRDQVGSRVRKVEELYAKSSSPLITRSRAEVEQLMAEFELVDPGLVYPAQWRPDSPDDADDHPERSCTHVVVGRKT